MKREEYRAQAERLRQKLTREDVDCEIYSSDDMATDRENEKALWLTDDSRVAKMLLSSGCFVLALLYEQNAPEDFSGCRYACEDLEELEISYLDRIWRRYARLPWDILETGRCLVRETTEQDVEDFYRIYREPSITRYMEKLYEDPEQERAYARDYIDQVYSFYNFGIWTVLDKESGQVIGRAGICYREGYEEPEIGFIIAKPWQGKGYATEVCGAILNYAREELGFSRVLAFVHPKNAVSIHICKKLGLDVRELPEE